MKRREFLTNALPLAAGTAVLAGCGATESTPAAVNSQPRVTWRMASSFPRSLDILYGAVEFFARRVDELTDGRFTIRAYPAGEIVPGNQVMDAVQQGTVQCGQTASYYYTGKHEALAFDTCVPFGLTARQQFAWMQAGGLELIREILADFNIISFPAGSTGAQMGGWFRRDITSVNDLNGLKMRIPGLGGEVMSRMNVTVQLLSGADVYMALERGAIDAVEWVGPYDDEKLGFHKIIKNYYYPGWWEPGAMLSHYVNQPAWEKLPPAYQHAIAAASAETCLWMTAKYDTLNPEALDRLLAEGVQLHKFPNDLMAAAEKIATQLMEEKAANNPAYAKVYTHWKNFRASANRWFATSELAYQNYILPPFAPK